MLSVEQARAAMLREAKRLPAQRVRIDDALGRVLAAPISARRDQPPFSASAMDGYALRAADAPGVLRIVGESAAGRGFAGALPPNACIRVSTGAPVPAGADTVLMQEDARIENDALHVGEVVAGRHVRARAGDFRAGAQLLDSGRRLRIGDVALAASVGCAELEVTRLPRVHIISGGDELVRPGEEPGPDQIFESGSYAVAALTRAWGGEPSRGAPLPDAPEVIAARAREAMAACDVLVLIGGASVGPHDHGRAAAASLGLSIEVEKVAVKPGKPTWFARGAGACVLGLPGNPASALVCARLFLAPLLYALSGDRPEAATTEQTGVLARALGAAGGRENYSRASLSLSGGGPAVLTPASDQDSSLVTVLSGADALIRQKADSAALEAGRPVSYLGWAPAH